jgi:uncharacterized protein (TIGR00290 family)
LLKVARKEADMKAACCWSGGKDSAMAYLKAIQSGVEITKVVNFVSQDSDRCCFHGIPAGLIRQQSELMGVELMQVQMPDSIEGYEKRFIQMLRDLKSEGITAMVFGDIYLDQHKDWIEKICSLENFEPMLPLWGSKPAQLLEDMDSIGLGSVVVSCLEKLGSDFISKEVSPKMLDWFYNQQICPCGEHGEYHTVVTKAPMFSHDIVLTQTETMLVDGFWKHWHLEIQSWTTKNKTTRM